jgi:hypothetical protein
MQSVGGLMHKIGMCEQTVASYNKLSVNISHSLGLLKMAQSVVQQSVNIYISGDDDSLSGYFSESAFDAYWTLSVF